MTRIGMIGVLLWAWVGTGCVPDAGISSDPWHVCADGEGGLSSLEGLPGSGTACEGNDWGCTSVESGTEGWTLFCLRGRLAVVSYRVSTATEICGEPGTVEATTTEDPCQLDLTWCGHTGLIRAGITEHGCASDTALGEASQASADCEAILDRARPGDPCNGSWSCGDTSGDVVRAAWCATDVLHVAHVFL